MLIILCVSITVNVLLAYTLVVFAKRLLTFDTIFNLLQSEIEENVKFLTKVSNRDLFSNSPEVAAVHSAFNSMRNRMAEFLIGMSDRPKKQRNKNPPVTA